MKIKGLIALGIAAIVSVSLCACVTDAPCTEHIDKNENGLCDECGAEIAPAECLHYDGYIDHVCDKCGEVMDPADHFDYDSDHACDYCGSNLSSCMDIDRDKVCDICANEYISECKDHFDEDYNYLCDFFLH